MKERPILFSGPMVRAILDGSKTQTRRAVSSKRFPCADWGYASVGDRCHPLAAHAYGTPGDRLWVRETWAVQHEYDAAAPSEIGASARWRYAATEDLGGLRKRPSIFLPRRGSRILLEITDVRVQRLQEISEGDARAEGAQKSWAGWPRLASYRSGFQSLWESINGTGSWHANPWVWAITFQRLGGSDV
jgi:hypothetical protein